MHRKTVVSLAAALAFGLGGTMLVGAAQADNFWDMMDPEWCFGDDDDDDWRYRAYGPGRYYSRAPYGWGGYPGYYGVPHGVASQPGSTQKKVPPPKLPEEGSLNPVPIGLFRWIELFLAANQLLYWGAPAIREIAIAAPSRDFPFLMLSVDSRNKIKTCLARF